MAEQMIIKHRGETDPLLGTRKINGREPYATYLNDGGKDFNYIADRIEKYL